MAKAKMLRKGGASSIAATVPTQSASPSPATPSLSDARRAPGRSKSAKKGALVSKSGKQERVQEAIQSIKQQVSGDAGNSSARNKDTSGDSRGKRSRVVVLTSEGRRKKERMRRKLAGGHACEPHQTAAEKRMNTVQQELSLFDRVVRVPEFVADPFAAVQQHLSATMETLQPQTPDVGRLPRNSISGTEATSTT